MTNALAYNNVLFFYIDMFQNTPMDALASENF